MQIPAANKANHNAAALYAHDHHHRSLCVVLLLEDTLGVIGLASVLPLRSTRINSTKSYAACRPLSPESLFLHPVSSP